MKWFISCILACCALADNAVFAQSNSNNVSRDSAELVAIEQALMDSIPSGDTLIWWRRLAADFFIVTEDGTRLDRRSFMASLQPLPKGFSGYIKIIHPKCVVAGETAVINYVSDEHEFVYGQQLHTSYSSMDTWIKNKKGWTMICSQVFEVPQLPLAIAVDAVILQRYTGTYQLQDSITCTVALDHDSLFLQKKGRMREALLAETTNVFFRMTDTRGRKIFVSNEQGTLQMLERRNGQDLVWKRIKG